MKLIKLTHCHKCFCSEST